MATPIVPSKSWAEWKQVLHGLWVSPPSFTEKDYPSLEGKVVVVTGGNTGIGYQTVKSLAGSTKARVYIFSRNREKTLKAIEDIKLEIAKEYNVVDREIGFVQVDFNDLTTVKPAVEEFLKLETRLDILILNAGVMNTPLTSAYRTKQGYEMQLGVNVLGDHLLTALLDPVIIETSKTNPPGLSRIVWVSSSAHYMAPKGGIFWEDYNFEKQPDTKSNRMIAYAQSKAGNILQAKTWPRKHDAPNVISSSICPGYLMTELQRYSSPVELFITKWITYPCRNGAYTELYAALSPDVKSGDHSISFGQPGIVRGDLNDEANADKVWDWLNEQIEPYL
ncbi:uncharacterized protein LODBEIA_P24220 [Lodderomyces beijingensis]|uniref:Uncharacterized protein n=1 Tax=Lodderomyces beijingensis TaxID=1775926 RepID=A0ABP0ZJ89_9ASCO